MKTLQILTCLLCVCAITACATSTQNIYATKGWKQEEKSNSTSYVFGKIQWFEHGKKKKMEGAFGSPLIHTLLRIEDRERIHIETSKSGEFIWELKPGTYVIARLNYWDSWTGSNFIVPKVAFRIAAEAETYYIGTLKADLATKRDFIGGISGSSVQVTIEDQGDESYATVTEKLKVKPEDIKTSLMVYDSRLPRTFDTTIEFNAAVQILNAILIGL